VKPSAVPASTVGDSGSGRWFASSSGSALWIPAPSEVAGDFSGRRLEWVALQPLPLLAESMSDSAPRAMTLTMVAWLGTATSQRIAFAAGARAVTLRTASEPAGLPSRSFSAAEPELPPSAMTTLSRRIVGSSSVMTFAPSPCFETSVRSSASAPRSVSASWAGAVLRRERWRTVPPSLSSSSVSARVAAPISSGGALPSSPWRSIASASRVVPTW
jgi:hypothetical protein